MEDPRSGAPVTSGSTEPGKLGIENGEIVEYTQNYNFKLKKRILASTLKDFTALKTLNLSWNNLGNGGVKQVLDALQDHSRIECVDLSYNGIDDDCGEHLCEFLRERKSLKVLNLMENDIGVNGLKHIVEGLKSRKALGELNLSRNVFGSEGEEQMSHIMSHVATLVLSGNYLSKGDMEWISRGLIESAVLEDLDLSHNECGDQGALTLAKGVRASQSLRSLDVSRNGIGNEGLEGLLGALDECASVKVVKIDDNTCEAGDSTVRMLQACLAKLVSASVQNLFSDASGLENLASHLEGPSAVRTLNLGWNAVSPTAMDKICTWASANANLTTFSLRGCNVGDGGARHIAGLLEKSTALKSLDLFCNEIGDAGVTKLCESLLMNKSLSSINLSANIFSDVGRRTILQMLLENKCLEEVFLQFLYLRMYDANGTGAEQVRGRAPGKLVERPTGQFSDILECLAKESEGGPRKRHIYVTGREWPAESITQSDDGVELAIVKHHGKPHPRGEAPRPERASTKTGSPSLARCAHDDEVVPLRYRKGPLDGDFCPMEMVFSNLKL